MSLSSKVQRLIVHHIPVCPFSQRLQILAELKNLSNKGDDDDGVLSYQMVDITKPRDAHILKLTQGTTSLPVLEIIEDNPDPDNNPKSLKESLVLMNYLEDCFPELPVIQRADPYERAKENLLVCMEGAFANAGYRLLMNQDPSQRDALVAQYWQVHKQLGDFLLQNGYNDETPWLFDRFGWAEAVYTPFFQRFWFLEYYENVYLEEDAEDPSLARVARWRQACIEHSCAQQVSREEIIKIYYDYSHGVGNGALPPGRNVSSFSFVPHWKERPMPPSQKYGTIATDEELGLIVKA